MPRGRVPILFWGVLLEREGVGRVPFAGCGSVYDAADAMFGKCSKTRSDGEADALSASWTTVAVVVDASYLSNDAYDIAGFG